MTKLSAERMAWLLPRWKGREEVDEFLEHIAAQDAAVTKAAGIILTHECTIARLEAELAEANRCREFGYQECVKHLEELAACKAELATAKDCHQNIQKFGLKVLEQERDEARALAGKYRSCLEQIDALSHRGQDVNQTHLPEACGYCIARQALEGGAKE